MRKLIWILPLLLAACGSPRNIEYCHGRYGLAPNTPAWENCMADFARNQAIFDRDRTECSINADVAYPPSLYDRGHYETYRVLGYSGWPRHERVFVPPDYHHNAQLDALRERIIAPCMFERGWLNSREWEAGRRPNYIAN